MSEPITTVLILLFSVFVFVAIIAFVKWHDYSQERKLRELVAWSAIGDVSALFLTVWNAQYGDTIDKKHRITEAEKQYVIEVIEAHQKDIARSYFNGHLKLIKSKYVVRKEDYFMLALYGFLSDHQCDYQFLGYDMHKEKISYKSYGESFSAGFDATYALTDFAVVFHKMYYITYLFCKNSKIANPNGDAFCNEKSISNILESKQIKISRV